MSLWKADAEILQQLLKCLSVSLQIQENSAVVFIGFLKVKIYGYSMRAKQLKIAEYTISLVIYN
jgi:hypothetical protein